MSRTHELRRRIYYHDTDAGGIVYHANYLNYCEEGRMEYFNDRNLDVVHIVENYKCMFVTVHCEINWKSPTFLNQEIIIKTNIDEIRRSSLLVHHIIQRADTILSDIIITLVCVSPDGKVMKIPDEIRAALD